MKTYQFSNEDYLFLKGVVGDNHVLILDQIEKDFTHDELKTVTGIPDFHVYVTDKSQISSIMTYANHHKIPVTVRGSGTGLVGACVAVYGGILLDTSKMNKILELDKINMTLKVEPGVILLDIYEKVEKEGLFYAPDPGEKTATIGGNISTNAGGMRAVKYGVTRDWVRGLEVVLPTGEIIDTGGKVVKNSTGFAIKDLIIGSEGTLGIIVSATLKLIALPKKTMSLLVPFANNLDAISAAPTLLTEHVMPTAIEFLNKEALKYSEAFMGKKIPNHNYDAYLLLSYDGHNEDVLLEDIEKASKLCIEKLNAIDVYLIDTEERKKSVWSIRGAFLEAIKASTSEIDECDVVLPRSHIAEFLDFTQKLSQELNLRIPFFGHVGDGNLHIYFCKDQLMDHIWKSKRDDGFMKLYQKAFSLGGLVSGEHGVGYAKKDYMELQVGKKQVSLMKEIKTVFDPNHILNPGKII
jgi:glycolate oxidase